MIWPATGQPRNVLCPVKEEVLSLEIQLLPCYRMGVEQCLGRLFGFRPQCDPRFSPSAALLTHSASGRSTTSRPSPW